jgi:hypothetical protein
MTIKGLLLAGASLATVGAGAAYAAPTIHVAALHNGFGNGHAAVKTSMHHATVGSITSTYLVYSSVSTAADYKVKTNLKYTFYTYYNSGSLCDANAQKLKVKLSTKKTAYAKLSTGVESYTEGCATAVKFYGDVYDLTTKTAVGSVDSFVSSLEGKKIHFEGGKYNITLNLDLEVFIES